MAFTSNSYITDSGANTNAARINRYRSADSLATIKGAGYFDLAVTGTAGGGFGLRNGDLIFTEASDGESFLFMAVSAVNVATTSSANDFL